MEKWGVDIKTKWEGMWVEDWREGKWVDGVIGGAHHEAELSVSHAHSSAVTSKLCR